VARASRANADRAAGAADILDDHRLAERRAHFVGHDARGDVGRSARRKRHDQRDRARGKIVGARRHQWRDQGQRDEDKRSNEFSHGPSPVNQIGEQE
jgi:hypothetical protein